MSSGASLGGESRSSKTYYMRDGDKPDRTPPFSLRLTKQERQMLESRAGSMPLASYIKSVLFADNSPVYRKRRKPPVADQKALADVLACLGASRIPNNLNQLAKAANIGDLFFDEETKRRIARACDDISTMRLLLMRALGFTPSDPPKNETVSQTFARTAAPKRFGV